MMVRSSLLLLLSAITLGMGGQAPPERSADPGAPPFLDRPTPWADSVYATLSLDERIAQLMMVAAYSNKDAKHEAEIEQLVKERNIGGLIFFQGGPHRQAKLTNRYQALAKTPLMLGMDLEWGLAMRLDSTIRFPRQMALGAHRNDALVEEMGLEIARQMKRLGVHVSFSPVVDVNNNPKNPVINDRSFGEGVDNVARKGIAYMRGLQRGGVLATAKHFPGHGDTDSDSHHALPFIAHGRGRLDSLELEPFRRIVNAGLGALMVAHLEVPALDPAKGVPSTLSKAIVTELLGTQLGFRGLVFTDALNMKGVANADKPGEIELRALLAGNDVMLFPQDPVKAIERIKLAVANGEVDSTIIDSRCLKLLRAKEWAGLATRKPIALKGLLEDLNTPYGQELRRLLYGGAITVAKDHYGLLPIRELDTLRIASVVIGDELDNAFQKHLKRYAEVTLFRADKAMKADSLASLLKQLKGFNRVVVSVHGTTFRVNKDFGVPASSHEIIRAIAQQQPTVLALFANPYSLAKAVGPEMLATVVVAYEETDDTQDLVAQVIFGARNADGALPVTASAFYAAGDGVVVKALPRLGYAAPEAVGIRSAELRAIDDIVKRGIEGQAYPGCQVLVAVDGQVIMNKAYGHQTYEKRRAVRTDDLYDLASITKVAATTLALMKLVDQGSLDLDQRLGHYLPELAAEYPAHAKMQLRDILTHQAGLKAFVPFHLRLMKDGTFKPNTVSPTASDTFPTRIAEGLYLHRAYTDSLVPWVLRTPLGTRGEYVYSDMGYYLLQATVERITQKPLQDFLQQEFYRPLGAAGMGYQPWKRFPKERIAPTEYDVAFRQRQIQGDVHDPGAALKGGVAGHAGLFSSANDLAILMQLLLNGGTYGGRRYISEAVITEFTKCQFCKPDGSGNRRALGFDKPARSGKGPTCDCVSYASFGHTGFTGTMVWTDPEQQVIYVFLSNRVYPNAERNKLVELGIRTKIQEVVHAAVAARIKPERMSVGVR